MKGHQKHSRAQTLCVALFPCDPSLTYFRSGIITPAEIRLKITRPDKTHSSQGIISSTPMTGTRCCQNAFGIPGNDQPWPMHKLFNRLFHQSGSGKHLRLDLDPPVTVNSSEKRQISSDCDNWVRSISGPLSVQGPKCCSAGQLHF